MFFHVSLSLRINVHSRIGINNGGGGGGWWLLIVVVAVRGPSVYFMDPTIHCMCLKNIMTPVYIHTFYVKDLRIQTLYYYFRYLLYRSTYSLLYGTSPCTVKYLNNILNMFLNYDNNYIPTYLRTHTSNNSWPLVM